MSLRTAPTLGAGSGIARNTAVSSGVRKNSGQARLNAIAVVTVTPRAYLRIRMTRRSATGD
jgi:hypothetical protein